MQVQVTHESKRIYCACVCVIDLNFGGIGWCMWIGLTLTDWPKHSFTALGKPRHQCSGTEEHMGDVCRFLRQLGCVEEEAMVW